MLRRIAAEGIGSLLLAATVIGSGIMAERLAAGNLAVALIANTGATVAVLATLIALLGPVSGAHFNPAVSLVQALRGALPWREAAAYVPIQVLGCCAGAVLAHAMFSLPLIQSSLHQRTGMGQWIGEFRGDPRSLAGRPRPPQGRGRTLDGRRLDRSGLLVYLINLIRQSGHHHRTLALEYLCGHLAVPCSGVHRGSATRRPCCGSRCPTAVSPARDPTARPACRK